VPIQGICDTIVEFAKKLTPESKMSAFLLFWFVYDQKKVLGGSEDESFRGIEATKIDFN
jgi:hypothetical protein